MKLESPLTSPMAYAVSPAIHADAIAFVSDGDVWLAELQRSATASHHQPDDLGHRLAALALAPEPTPTPLRALRLTTNGGASHVIFSPCGSWLAFSAATPAGGCEVFAMPTEGGRQPEQLTHLGDPSTSVVGWLPGASASSFTFPGAIVFRSAAEQPMTHMVTLWRVSAESRPRAFGVGTAHHACTLGDGRLLIGRHTVEPTVSQWLGYNGGCHGSLWIGFAHSGSDFARLELPPMVNPGHPFVVGSLICFVSDHEGAPNLFSVNIGTPGTLQRHTNFPPPGIREPSAWPDPTVGEDGAVRAVVAFHRSGELYLHVVVDQGATDAAVSASQADLEPRAIAMHRCGAPRARSSEVLDALDELESVGLHPKGHSLLVACHGRVFELRGLWSGPALARGVYDGCMRYAFPCYLANGRPVAAVCVGGDWYMEALDASMSSAAHGSGRLSIPIGDPTEVVANPERASLVAVATRDLRLLVVDFKQGTAYEVDRSEHDGGIFDVSWSHDGGWLAYAAATSSLARSSAIRLVRVAPQEAAQIVHVTDGAYRDASPSFDPDGQYLAFLSSRSLRAVEDEVFFSMHFPRAQRIFIATLDADAKDPMRPLPRPPGWTPEDDHSDDSDDGSEDSCRGGSKGGDAKEMRVEDRGIAERVRPLPLPAGRMQQLRMLWDGQIVYIAYSPAGAGRGGGSGVRGDGETVEGFVDSLEEEAGSLMRYTIGGSGAHPVKLSDGVRELFLSADLETMALRCDDGDGAEALRCVVAGERVLESDDEGDDEGGGDERDGHTPPSGRVPLDGRVRLEVSPGAEWQQMFAEAWGTVARLCHPSVTAGVDLSRIRDTYATRLASVWCAAELRDLLRCMLAELGASHASVSPPDDGGEFDADDGIGTDGAQGFLGAHFEWDEARGWNIASVHSGESFDEAAASPLFGRARPGDILLAINHTPLSRSRHPAQVLERCGGRDVELTLMPGSGRGGSTSGGGKSARHAGGGGTSRRDGAGRRSGRREHRPWEPGSGPGEFIVTVRAASLAQAKRYQYLDWVTSNRKRVHDICGSLVGYAHMSDMEERGFEDLCRQLLTQATAARGALLLDLRGNAGGMVSDLVLSRLLLPRLGHETPPSGLSSPVPEHAAPPALVVLVDESTASDAELVARALADTAGASVVGLRTWGGVFGADDVVLVDGTIVSFPATRLFLQSRSGKATGGDGNDDGWAIENRGVEPSFTVEDPPRIGRGYEAGPQLDAAARLGLELAERELSARQPGTDQNLARQPIARKCSPWYT